MVERMNRIRVARLRSRAYKLAARGYRYNPHATKFNKSDYIHKHKWPKETSTNVYKQGYRQLLATKTPLPDRFRCTMTFSEVVGCTATNTVTTFGTTQPYRLNSLYDPRFNAGGGQPYGFDQIASMYNKYMVYAVAIEAEFIAPSGPLLCALQIQQPNDTNDLTGKSIGFANELPGVMTKLISDTGEKKCVLRTYIPIHKAIGVRRLAILLDPDNYASVVSTNPVVTPYAKVALSNVTGAATAPTCTTNIKLVYYCEFFERVPLSES